jgi:hypothetical protein
MRSSSRKRLQNADASAIRRRSVIDELHIILEALKELHQLVRWPIPAEGVGFSRL